MTSIKSKSKTNVKVKVNTKAKKNVKVNSNENKQLFDKISKIKKRMRMYVEGENENEWKNAQSFQLTNLIKLLLEKKKNSSIKEMTFPFTSKKGNQTNDKIKITGDQKGTYFDTKRNTKHKFIYITLPKHNKANNNKKSPKK